MKTFIVPLSIVAILFSVATSNVTGEPRLLKPDSVSTDFAIEHSRSVVINTIDEVNQALQKQQAKVVKGQKKLATFATEDSSNQEYIDARRDLERNLAVMNALTDALLEHIKKLEVSD